MNIFTATGALFGMLAVIIGAFGAHGLEDMLTPQALKSYQTGVEYQFYHVFALLVVGILSVSSHETSRLLKLAGIFFILGIVLFSGSLYLYALTGKTYFGMITPIGGLGFIIGWLSLFIFALKTKERKFTNSTQLIHKESMTSSTII